MRRLLGRRRVLVPGRLPLPDLWRRARRRRGGLRPRLAGVAGDAGVGRGGCARDSVPAQRPRCARSSRAQAGRRERTARHLAGARAARSRHQHAAACRRRRDQGFLRAGTLRRTVRDLRLCRRGRLRSDGNGDHRALRHGARRPRAHAAWRRPDARLRAAAIRRRGYARRLRGGRARRAAASLRRGGARSGAGRAPA